MDGSTKRDAKTDFSCVMRAVRGYEDLNGQRMLDFGSSQFNLLLGYQHPLVIGAIQQQLSVLTYGPANTVFEKKGELVKQLAELTSGDLKSFSFSRLEVADADRECHKDRVSVLPVGVVL